MPPLSGEETVLTVFTDIHYYFTAPTQKPLHHRFDKGSYLYLYHNASQNKARIEIANNAGTAEQDAFNGALNQIHLQHSTGFPTRCTLTVDGEAVRNPQGFPPPPSADPHEWRLPSNDPRDESGDLLRLHTLDVYFWTIEDANQFMDSVERLLAPAHIETDRHPLPQSDNPMSIVVQQLENVAVTDPAYQNGQTRNSQSEAASRPITDHQVSPEINSAFPPPPASGPPAQQTATASQPPEEPKDPAQFAPLPYNPAAPAAPEPIQHREKTPPPEDGADGNGLAAAAVADNAPYTPPSQIASIPSFAPPPTQLMQYPMPGAYASPPPSAGLNRSFSSHSSIQSPPGVVHGTVPGAVPGITPGAVPYSPTFPGAGPPLHPYQTAAMQMPFSPPPQDPNAHLYSQPMYMSPPPVQQTAPARQHPIGGYSNFSYGQPQQQPVTIGDSGIHSQVYRPTQAEFGFGQKAMTNPGQRPRKLEDGAQRMESSVNRFFRKLEKKVG